MRLLQPMLLDNTQYSVATLNRLSEYFCQPKIDGVRLLVGISQEGETAIVTRTGKPVRDDLRQAILAMFDMPSLIEQFRYSVWFDCELVYKNDCASSAGILHSKHTALDTSALRLFIFDCILQDEKTGEIIQCPFKERIDMLDYCGASFLAGTVRVPTFLHSGHLFSVAVTRQFALEYDLPYEGYVLRHYNSLYEAGKRSNTAIKCKAFAELDLRVASVIAQEDTQGNEKPLAGTLICYPVLDDSSPADSLQPIKVTCSCNNALRAAILANEHNIVGRLIKVRYMPVKSGNTSGTLRMPRYISGLEDLVDGNV